MPQTQIMLPAVFNRKDFDNILRSMSDDDAAVFAATNRTTFASCFSLAEPGIVAPAREDAAPKPGPAKAREPKAAVPALDKAALDAVVLAALAPRPNEKSPTIAAAIYNPEHDGPNAKRFADAVLKSLKRLVNAGKVYQDGERKAARFKVATPIKAEEESAE